MNDDSTFEIRQSERMKFRKSAIAIRKATSEQKLRSEQMQNHLNDWLLSQSFEWICCYVEKPPEPVTSRSIDLWCRRGQFKVAVPFCNGDNLSLFALSSLVQLEPAAFGLLEPPASLRTTPHLVPPAKIQCFVVPGVAFDRTGNRIGYGRGYYDRLLADASPDAVKIGYCYSTQVVDLIPNVESWDIPMDYLLTEEGLVTIR